MRFHFARIRLIGLIFTLFLLLWGSMALSSAAYAQNYRAGLGGQYGRVFPEKALRGTFKVVQYPWVELDGKKERLAPGSRVINTQNRIIKPVTLTGKRVAVNYMRYANGQLHTVWLLTPREIREPRQVANPSWWRKLYQSLGSWVNVAQWFALASIGL